VDAPCGASCEPAGSPPVSTPRLRGSLDAAPRDADLLRNQTLLLPFRSRGVLPTSRLRPAPRPQEVAFPSEHALPQARSRPALGVSHPLDGCSRVGLRHLAGGPGLEVRWVSVDPSPSPLPVSRRGERGVRDTSPQRFFTPPEGRAGLPLSREDHTSSAQPRLVSKALAPSSSLPTGSPRLGLDLEAFLRAFDRRSLSSLAGGETTLRPSMGFVPLRGARRPPSCPSPPRLRGGHRAASRAAFAAARLFRGSAHSRSCGPPWGF